MNPPDNAVVLCVDEKTGIQALDRTQTVLPLGPQKPRAWTNEYVRHGTKTLLAALHIATGEVYAHVKDKRRSKEFLSFMDDVAEKIKVKGCVSSWIISTRTPMPQRKIGSKIIHSLPSITHQRTHRG